MVERETDKHFRAGRYKNQSLVMKCLEDQGIGFRVTGGHVIAIVLANILFDLGRCGTKFHKRPDADYGLTSCKAAAGRPVGEGNVWAGSEGFAGGLRGERNRKHKSWRRRHCRCDRCGKLVRIKS